MILLAGIGVVWTCQHAPKLLAVALVGLGVGNLGWQARAASFQYSSDPRNPWVYAHTGTDVFLIAKQMAALAAADPAGRAMPVQIFTRENLWPLPWYLRRYTEVRWWNGVSDTAPLAPVILATPDMEPALLHRIYEVPPPGQREMYVNMFDRYVELRPRVEVRGYVAKSLWDDLRGAMIIQPSDIGARRFAHQAMATEFEIFCVHADGDYAQQACWAAFDLLDRLEDELSRFIPNSDIARINRLAAGETARVSRWTMECLAIALAAYAETAGAFDISLGSGLRAFSLRRATRPCARLPARCGSTWAAWEKATR